MPKTGPLGTPLSFLLGRGGGQAGWIARLCHVLQSLSTRVLRPADGERSRFHRGATLLGLVTSGGTRKLGAGRCEAAVTVWPVPGRSKWYGQGRHGATIIPSAPIACGWRTTFAGDRRKVSPLRLRNLADRPAASWQWKCGSWHFPSRWSTE